MAPPVTRIYDVAAALLTAVVDGHGGALPDRQFVSAGMPAWDCELLAVWCEGTAGQEGDTARDVVQPHQAAAGHLMRTGTYVIELVRCTPAVPDSQGGQVLLPSVDEEEHAAAEVYGDAQRVLNALGVADIAGCHGIAFDRWQVVGPDGGFVGGRLRVRVGLAL